DCGGVWRCMAVGVCGGGGGRVWRCLAVVVRPLGGVSITTIHRVIPSLWEVGIRRRKGTEITWIYRREEGMEGWREFWKHR
ncbi:hypothetical protein LSAT2_016372, partial [Lamellibrachia satsuma]